MMLDINGLHVFYGGIEALKGVNIHVGRGEIVTLIGANGAGKSTLLSAICGCPPAAKGSITFDGRGITSEPTFKIMRSGMALSPEGRRIFPRLTVLENLQMGATAGDPKHFDEDLENIFAMFPVLKRRQGQDGGSLSGGEQQMLAIGRALMSRPKMLLLDEPSLGLAPMLAKQIFAVIREISQRRGVTILLVEQNAFQSLKLAARGYVMVNGRIVMEGTGEELLASPEIRAAYLEGGS